MTTVAWLLIFLVLVVVEAITIDLVSIWFAFGALVCSFVALITEDIFIQLMVFVFVSAVTLLCTRKFINKIKTRSIIPTNLDRIIGLTGIVTETVTDNSGEVIVDGKRWSAFSTKEISIGSKVEILAIDGVKLKVKLKKEEEK